MIRFISRLAPSPTGPLGAYLAKAGLLLSALLALAAPASLAHAQSVKTAKNQAINGTLTALANSGIVPIPPSEIQAMGPLLSCITDGDKTIGTCAKNAVYERILGSEYAGAAPIVECIVDGKPVADCAKQAALSQLNLPPEVRAALTCSNNVAQCASDAVISRLPQEAQDVIKCAQQGGTELECASRLAKGQTKQAIDDIKKMTDPEKGSQILQIFQAVQNEDWANLSLLVGEQVAKAVVCTVLEGLVGAGPHQAVLCDAAGILITKRVQDAKKLVEQAKALDFGGMLGTLAVAGLIERQCSFAEALDKRFETGLADVICGEAAKLITAAANSSAFVGVFTAVATTNPILGLAAFGVMELFGKDDDCPNAADYYRENFMACQHRAVFVGLTNPKALADLAQERQNACFRRFEGCLDKKTNQFCDGMRDKFLADARSLISAYTKLVDGHVRGLRSDLEADRSRVCGVTQEVWLNTQAGINYEASCERMLENVRPLHNLADAQCSSQTPIPVGGTVTFGRDPTAAEAACQKGTQTSLKKMLGEVCAGAGVCFPIVKCPNGQYFSGTAGQCLQEGPN